MQAAPAHPIAESGSITVELKTLNIRLINLRRFAEVKRQMRDLRAEYNRLEEVLFGLPEPCMAMLPNDQHPGPRCACRDCLRGYPDARP
jgi:hypothetical protein